MLPSRSLATGVYVLYSFAMNSVHLCQNKKQKKQEGVQVKQSCAGIMSYQICTRAERTPLLIPGVYCADTGVGFRVQGLRYKPCHGPGFGNLSDLLHWNFPIRPHSRVSNRSLLRLVLRILCILPSQILQRDLVRFRH